MKTKSLEDLSRRGLRFTLEHVGANSGIRCDECGSPMAGQKTLEVSVPIHGFFCVHGPCMRMNVTRYIE